MTPTRMEQTAQLKRVSRLRFGLVVILFALLASTQSANAQLTIPVIRGDNGLKSGSQPPPGFFVTELVYSYDTHETVDKDGNRSNRAGINQIIAGTALTYVSRKKFLGGNYSAMVVLPLLNLAI
ncbi:MAG TPA: hypothetical protein VIR01_04060, partial [Pyrinomonadaceae bacterium]